MNSRLAATLSEAWAKVRGGLEMNYRQELDAAARTYGQMAGALGDLQGRLTEKMDVMVEISRSQQQIAEAHRQLLAGVQAMAGDGQLKQALSEVGRQLARNNELIDSPRRGMESRYAPVSLVPEPAPTWAPEPPSEQGATEPVLHPAGMEPGPAPAVSEPARVAQDRKRRWWPFGRSK
jgi:hypothetical protein